MRIIHYEGAVKLLVFVVATFTFAALSYGFGSGGEGCSGDCTTCHSVKKEDAEAAVSRLYPGATVKSVGPSPVRGLYQIEVIKGDETGILYLDFSKRHLIAGRVIDTEYRRDVTEERLAELRRIDPARIPLDNALVLGNKNGSRKLYVFTDPECPYCARLHSELTTLVKDDPRLTVYILLMPLEMHPNSIWKTDTIVCKSKASMDAGLQLLELSFIGKLDTKSGCGSDYGNGGMKIGKAFGIGMTPTMVFATGKVLTGARTGKEIRKHLDDAEGML